MSYTSKLQSKYYNEIYTPKKWILDSGATSHMTNNKEHMYNVKQSDAVVGFGNQSKQQVSIQGDVDIIFKDKEN